MKITIHSCLLSAALLCAGFSSTAKAGDLIGTNQNPFSASCENDFQQIQNSSKYVLYCQLANVGLSQVLVLQTVTVRCQSTSFGNDVADVRDVWLNTNNVTTPLPLTRQSSLVLNGQTYGVWTAQVSGPLYFKTGTISFASQRLLAATNATRCDVSVHGYTATLPIIVGGQ